jgi:hypothetical protein
MPVMPWRCGAATSTRVVADEQASPGTRRGRPEGVLVDAQVGLALAELVGDLDVLESTARGRSARSWRAGRPSRRSSPDRVASPRQRCSRASGGAVEQPQASVAAVAVFAGDGPRAASSMVTPKPRRGGADDKALVARRLGCPRGCGRGQTRTTFVCARWRRARGSWIDATEVSGVRLDSVPGATAS